MKDRYYVCSHTHWDREWYGSYQQFRMRLVKLVDDLLDILDNDPNYKCFNFDGQTVVLEDYLEIRPENEGRLRKYIESGRIVVGPWYMLPDEFLVTGESTVRNLIFGEAVANRFGKISSVGYLPDTFGHFSQIPQILKQWGIDTAILWRGVSGDEIKNELIWESPDGSSVLLWRIPEKYGYITASLFAGSLPPKIAAEMEKKGIAGGDMVSGDDAVQALVEACDYVKNTAEGNVHLLLNGVDHMAPNPGIPGYIESANQKLDGEMIHASFDEFAKDLLAAIKGKNLQKVKGELRDTIQTKTGTGFVLNGVLSSRIYLKQQNQDCCTLLENWVEPFNSFYSMLGGKYDKGFIQKAWQWVLKNHPHDSIGGCSIDSVHRQMETRFEWAKDISENMLEFIFTGILENVGVDGVGDGEYAFAVFNPHQEKQSGWIKAEIEIPWSIKKGPAADNYKGVQVSDMSGTVQPSWLLGYEPNKCVNRPSLRTFATAQCCPAFTISFWAEDVPALGYKLFKFKPLTKPNCVFGSLSPERNVLENDYIRAEINFNGTIKLTDKSTGLVYDNLHYFEDGGDNGGGYAYSFPKSDEVLTSLSKNAEIAMIENSQARAAYKITVKLDVPESLDESKQARSKNRIPLVIESVISLGAGSKRLDIETTVVNNVSDHRLRAMFPSYVKSGISSADAQFDVVDHPVEIAQPAIDVWMEDQPKQFAQKSFASISDGNKGLTVASMGLPEYELSPDNERAIGITLLRAVSHLSNAWKNTRIWGAGPGIETPEAQMLGRTLVFNYSIIPHAGVWHDSDAQKQAQAFVRGMRAFPVIYTGSGAKLPNEQSFVSVEGEKVALSSIKQCEDGDGYIIRLWNGSEVDSKAALCLFKQPGEVYLSDIRERKLRQLTSEELQSIPIAAKSIVTIRIHF